ncbi:ZYRO0E00396p [Zygosaccharomyces rouxii]|uniref:ZYRO0E00396p n=1 Tax=Zygosaccharomyces rouxii (strain ATCC 2623 / CBS 732 / NBRC 1130 / NCYC 568 / NRRL Y-229) TaxID=559307 RepID=C5E3U8_ZYGRC|nr:uncharacterized protein ZYRO0E00396g [Zygosaccharomyces rouxii]KAH9198428.1 hypothetical protein LQ764DRAFT_214874 [Zygosaccharomyces rouxii]CAR30709.1 ZYRO0E00396p [Zygosaccharomyces rouxii]
MNMSFGSIPVIDLGQAFDNETKPKFLENLRHALITVGFLRLTNFGNYGPTTQDFQNITQQGIEFFELPEEEKKKVEMINSPHFLGYTKLGNEITSGKIDWREQIDLATELPAPTKDGPLYKQLEGPNLWPDERVLPYFKLTMTSYIDKMSRLSSIFTKLVAESIGLSPNALDTYFKENQQCKMKIVAYPADTHYRNDVEAVQGVGPHKDSDFLTFVYQASDHKDTLQVQNFKGEWISVDNIPGSLVVNVGQTLEAITCGVCKATIHQVLRPRKGSGTRLSIPFFRTVDLESKESAVSNISHDVWKLKEERDKTIDRWGIDTGFQYRPDFSQHPAGYAVFRNRIKSHRDVAAKWYPELLAKVLTEIA